MSAFLASPVWGAIIAALSGMISGIFIFIWRILVKMDKMDAKVESIATDVTEIKNDPNIIRWSDLRPGVFRRRRRGF